MSTEQQLTLEQVQNAFKAVEKARASSSLTQEQNEALEGSSVKLFSLEQALIRKKGEELISALSKDSDSLNALAKQIKDSAHSLAEIAGVVENAVQVVKALIVILSAAAGAGIV